MLFFVSDANFFTACIGISVAVAKAPLTTTTGAHNPAHPHICFSANTATAMNSNYHPRNYNATVFAYTRRKASAGVSLSSASGSVRHHDCTPTFVASAASAVHSAPGTDHPPVHPAIHGSLLAWMYCWSPLVRVASCPSRRPPRSFEDQLRALYRAHASGGSPATAGRPCACDCCGLARNGGRSGDHCCVLARGGDLQSRPLVVRHCEPCHDLCSCFCLRSSNF